MLNFTLLLTIQPVALYIALCEMMFCYTAVKTLHRCNIQNTFYNYNFVSTSTSTDFAMRTITTNGNVILSLIIYFLFLTMLYIPAGTLYYAEEIEFTDSEDDAGALRRSFLITAVLSIIPWLF